MKKRIGILFFLLIDHPLSTKVFAHNQSNASVILCNQRYALCSAAKCIPDPRHPNYALCRCEVYKGLSAGYLSCLKRRPRSGNYNTLQIISTFSFKNADKASMICPKGTLWTNCLDAPCTVSPDDSKSALCSCPIEKAATIVFTFGGQCDSKSCDSDFWSAATPKQSSLLRKSLRKVKSAIPSTKQCLSKEN